MAFVNKWQHLSSRAASIANTNPVAFFYLFRWLTWLLAVAIVFTRSAPYVNLRYEPGLLMYTAFQLALGLLYATSLRSRLNPTPDGIGQERPSIDPLVVGVADMIGSLVILFFSGGLGTPFFHLVVTSLLVPCFLLPTRRGLAVAFLFGACYVVAVFMAGELLGGAVGLGHASFITQVTRDVASVLFIGGAVVYLGHLFRTLQAERRRTKQALDETEMLFTLTQDLVRGGTEMEPLLMRLAQVMRRTGIFDRWALFLAASDGKLELAASTVGIEEVNMVVVEETMRKGRTATGPGATAGQWQTTVPLKVGEETLGVMVAGNSASKATNELSPLAEAVAGQIAIGLQNAILAIQKADLAAQEERSRIAREIHDGVAQSIYMLSLHLETCAELASQGRSDLPQRLGGLVNLSKQALLEVRHYIFDLKPYLEGEQSVASMLASQVGEFTKVSGVPASFEVKGEPRPLSIPAATCLYRVTQEALANVFRHARASQVRVTLDFLQSEARLTVADNGIGLDLTKAAMGNGLGNMRHRTQVLGGDFQISATPGQGTGISIHLPC
ncbi:MAG: sensor histidine kinase [Chloroflexi bacterium]|nr:sensor histidine kinase [Chloroflexota bacterium]